MISEKHATLLARLGLACRGLVYIIVGWLAVDAAFRGGRTADSNGAIASLADKPFGWLLLLTVAVGLLGYALWRTSEALVDRRNVFRDIKSFVNSAGLAFSAVVHAVLAWTSLKLAIGARSSRDSSPNDEQARDWTAWLLSQPFGRLLVAMIAACFVFGAFNQFRKSWTGDFAGDLGRDTPRPAYFCTVGRIGFAARGTVFLILALFFATAAWRSRASEAGGMADALASLQKQPGGMILLVVAGIGLCLFGVYGIVEARFRRVRVSVPG